MTHIVPKRVLAFCIAALALASGVFAQTDDGRENANQRVAEGVMASFAKCVVGNKKREAKALEYLLLPDGDPRKSAQGSAIAVSGCAPPGSQMRFQPDLFSRSIYTALYRKYYWRSPPGDLPASDATDYRSEYDVTTTPVATQQLALRAFGDCAVKQNPGAAHDFAISEMRGQSEKAAVPVVVEAMKPCLDNGATLKFSRTMLKGIVAESLYKMRVRQPRAAAAGGLK